MAERGNNGMMTTGHHAAQDNERPRTAVAKTEPESSVNIARLKRYYDTLKASRGTFESHWEEIAEYIVPNGMGFTGKRSVGEKKLSRMMDSTGVQANEHLAAGLHGLATNPASKWFSMRMTDGALQENDEVKQYLADVEDRMWSAMYAPGTNFTTALHETYLGYGAFGTSIMYVGQRESGGLLFQTRMLSECIIDENAEGSVDTVFRCTEYTVRQMMQMKRQGWTISDRVKKLYEEEKYDEKIKVIHAVYPRDEREYGKKDRSNMPFASCYFEHEACHELEMSGVPEFPYLTPRWSKLPGEVYGRGPGMTALPDVKMLQAMVLTCTKALQKNADPPMWLPDDGHVGPVRTVPGGVNYYRGNREVFLHPTNIQGLEAAFKAIEELRNRIRTTFFNDILQFVREVAITATEWQGRTQERMRLMGPMIGRLEAELLGQVVTRVFGLLHREGKLPPAPDIIADQEFTVEYVSMLASAQKQSQAEGISHVIQFFAPLGPEAVGSIAQQNLDVPATFRWLWDLFNNDPKLLKHEDKIAQDGAMQQGMQMLQQAAPALQQGASGVKSLADAQAGGGMDLQALMQQATQQAQGMPAVQRGAEQMAEMAQ